MNFTDIMLLENKAQYAAMLQPLVTLGLIDSGTAKDVLTFSRKNLKRNDRIVWWLKWYRILKLTSGIQQLKNDPENPLLIKMQKMLDKAAKGMPANHVAQDARGFNSEFGKVGGSNLNHYISMMNQVPSMDNVVWDAANTPSELKTKLDKKQAEWQQAADQEIDVDKYDDVANAGRSPWKKVIDYGAQAWVLIDKGYCDLEGKAMGHCGNNQYGNEGARILSFRTIVNEKRHKPHLTFIIDEAGFLGEMKGRANEKPAPKYHKVIIDLLLSDMVNGLKGGGHDPANNFSLDDLEAAQQEVICNKKPELAPLAYKVKKGTATAKDFEWMGEIFGDSNIMQSGTFEVDLKNKTVRLEKFPDVDDIVFWAERYNFNNLKFMTEIVVDGYIEQYEYPRPDNDDLQTILDGIDDKWRLALEKYVEQNMTDPDEYSPDDLIQIISGDDELDEVSEAFDTGHMAAIDTGSYDDLYAHFDRALRDNGISFDQTHGQYVWKTSIDNAMDLFNEITEDEGQYDTRETARSELQLSDADEARYGYSGFHAESGSERLTDSLYEITELKKIFDQMNSENNESVDRMKTLAGIQ
jgi:hypothetical protein